MQGAIGKCSSPRSRSPSSSPSSRSPSPGSSRSHPRRTWSNPPRNTQSCGPDCTATSLPIKRSTRASPGRQKANRIPAAHSLSKECRNNRSSTENHGDGGVGGGSSRRLSSQPPTSPPESSPGRSVGDMRAMCPAGPDSFVGTTDGGLGVESLADSLGLGLSAFVSSGSIGRRVLNDSFNSLRSSVGGLSRGGKMRDDFRFLALMNGSVESTAEAKAAGQGSEAGLVRATDVGDSGCTAIYFSPEEDLVAPPPPTTHRCGEFQLKLPGENWQAETLRSRLMREESAGELSGQSMLQPPASAFSDASIGGVIQAAVLALRGWGAGGAVTGRPSLAVTPGSEFIGAKSGKSSPSSVPLSPSGEICTVRCRTSVTAAVLPTPSCSGSPLPESIRRPPNSAPPSESKSTSLSTGLTSTEILDLRGKFCDGSGVAGPTMHNLLRLPLGGVDGSAGNEVSTAKPWASIAAANGAPTRVHVDVGGREKERGTADGSSGSEGGRCGRKESVRQPFLLRVTTNRPTVAESVHAGRNKENAVTVQTLASLPPCLSSPDIVASSDDGVFVCVGSHACGLVACYRVATMLAPTAPVAGSPFLSSASIAPPSILSPGRHSRASQKPRSVVVSADLPPEHSTELLSGVATETVEGRNPTSHPVADQTSVVQPSPSARSFGDPATGATGTAVVGAEAMSQNCDSGRSGRPRYSGSRIRPMPRARPVCTFRLPMGLRVKGLAFTSKDRLSNQDAAAQEELRDSDSIREPSIGERNGYRRGRKNEGDRPMYRPAERCSADDAEDGIVVLVLAAGPASANASSRGNPATFGTSIGDNHRGLASSCYRTVLLRFLVPKSAGVEEAANARGPPHPKSEGAAAASAVAATASTARLGVSRCPCSIELGIGLRPTLILAFARLCFVYSHSCW